MILRGLPDMRPPPSTAAVAILLASLCACKRAAPPPTVSLDVAPSARFSPEPAQAGQPLAVTYRWAVGPRFERTETPYVAFVHFVAADGGVLFTDDHTPAPPVSSWEPGAIFEYARLVFTHRQFPGPLTVRLGLYDSRDGRRVALAAAHVGQGAYRVGVVDVRRHPPQQGTLFYSGFSEPWTHEQQPFESFRWMAREGIVACRNPRAEAVLFLRASADVRGVAGPPRLRVSVGGLVREHEVAGDAPFTIALPIDAERLGSQDFTDVTLTMSEGRLSVDRVVLLPKTEVTPEVLSAAAVL
jgi:hypothetical protein